MTSLATFSYHSLLRVALLASAIPGLGIAQQASLTLGSGATVPGGSVNLNLSLTTTGGAQPSSFEWTLSYSPTAVSGVTVTAGSSSTAAGKTVTCAIGSSSAVCVLYGMNETVVANGVLATVSVTIASGTVSTSTTVQVTGVDAAAAAGTSIPATGSGGVVTINQPTKPTVSSLTCTPASVTAPATPTCTVTLSAGALAGGSVVTLSSNNGNVTVPASITVAAGASAGTFTATVNAVAISQTATLTASSGGASRTFSLSVVAPVWTISGAISPSSLGGGTTVTLNGAASQTVAADASGNYTFSGLPNGSYTVTPAKSGYALTPRAGSVTVNGANLAAVNFTIGQSQPYLPPTVDNQVSKDQSTASSTVASPAFSTSTGNELMLAFVSVQGNAIVNSVTGAGLPWELVVRTNGQQGTAEIWRAFAAKPLSRVTVTASLSGSVISSLTVSSFIGADASGVNGSGAIGATGTGNGPSGAPMASLVTTRNNSLVLGVGDDPKAAVAPAPLSGQLLVHQYLPENGTLWVQSVSNPVALNGTSVVFGDSAPKTDPYNLSLVEVLAATLGADSISSMNTGPKAAPNREDRYVLSPDYGATLSSPATGLTGNVCSPGGLASLTGAGFTSQNPATAASSPLPLRLAGLRVNVNGQPARLLFASASQVTFQCPRIRPGLPLDVTVEAENGVLVRAKPSFMAPAAPGIFSAGGTQQGVVLVAPSGEIAMPTTEGTLSRPARHGEYLTIYASGLGDVAEGVTDGLAAPLDRQIRLNQEVRVVIGNTEAEATFAGLTPGTVGVFQVNFRLPQNVSAGPAVPLHLDVILPDGTAVPSNTVTMAVDQAF